MRIVGVAIIQPGRHKAGRAKISPPGFLNTPTAAEHSRKDCKTGIVPSKQRKKPS